MSRKKRVLWPNEASFFSTGYSTYGQEVLKRLHATGKYDLMELAAYGLPNDERAADIPWKYMGVLPHPDNQAEADEYNANPVNQFGEWKLHEACLAHRPEAVISIRDVWMESMVERSPFRQRFHWAYMPTVDAELQDENWLSTFMNADALFAYTDWGLALLQRQTNGRAKLKCSAPPGADIETLRPIADKRAHRQSMGMDADAFIVGTVMRNQKRKLFPDLLPAFAQFLREAPPELARKTYLYLHTSWPDVGWDIPRLLNESGLGSRCLFTYHCLACGCAFASFFQDARTICRHCGKDTARFPNSNMGVSRKTLGAVMNTFDCYVQYANSEGFGMPAVEAAACGVPVFAVDYSGMSDVVRKLGGYPIAVERLTRESETHCWRAAPDNSQFVRLLIDFLSKPEVVRKSEGYRTRKAVETHYTYDRTAKIWEDHLDSIAVRDAAWAGPPQLHKPATTIPNGLSNEEFVRWGIHFIAGRPDLQDSYMALRMVRDLNWGASLPQMGGLYFNEESTLGTQNRYQEFTRQHAYQALVNLCELKNHWERRRVAQ